MYNYDKLVKIYKNDGLYAVTIFLKYVDSISDDILFEACRLNNTDIIMAILTSTNPYINIYIDSAICYVHPDVEMMPFHFVMLNGNINIVKLFLKHPKSSEFINKCDHHKITPLHYGCRAGNFDAVKLLLYSVGGDNNIDINAQDFYGNTPLISACYAHACKSKLEYLGIIELIVKHKNFNSLDKYDNWGYNAEQIAERFNFKQFFELILCN